MLTWPIPQIPEIPPTQNQGGVIRIFDSTTAALQPSTEAGATQASLYVCGITPYDATHLGHAATYVTFDLLNRAWRDAGLTVTYASNITDVDDPLLERAKATDVDWRDLALSQAALFAQDMTQLGVIPPDVYLGAVETIPEVARVVESLLERGLAYRVSNVAGVGGDTPELGDVYADISKDPHFGSTSNLDPDTQLAWFAERGGDPDRTGKRHALDPLLWRRERVGEPSWDGGALGTGRPGWHIECTVIARRGLGVDFDIQGGGRDLLFPHHEMSSSHARVVDDADGLGHGSGARAHLHAGLVGYHGEKMSKSLGNLVLVSKLVAEGVDPMVIRLALLAHHYREDWEWFDSDIDAATDRLATWRTAMSGYGGVPPLETVTEIRAALAADLDSPRALQAVDLWSAQTLAESVGNGQQLLEEGAPGVIARTINALLGIRL